MPEICLFFGIRITMYYADHTPPHFHAKYGDYEALVSIQDCAVIRGELPKRQLHYVLAWASLFTEELMQNWELAKSGLPLQRIPPIMRGEKA